MSYGKFGFSKLSMRTETVLQKIPLSGHLFVFFNKRGDKCKILLWVGSKTGFVVWYKRLEEGTFEKLTPLPGQASLEMDVAKLTWLLKGIDPLIT